MNLPYKLLPPTLVAPLQAPPAASPTTSPSPYAAFNTHALSTGATARAEAAVDWSRAQPPKPAAVLPYADIVRHRSELLHPHRFSMHDHVNVLRFVVTRTRLAPGDSIAAVDLAFAYNRWAEALAIPTLTYADIVGALDAILTHAPANALPRLAHGAASHVLDLALRETDPPRVPTIIPEPLPRDYTARTKIAARGLPTFGAGPVTDDMITFKFVDMFTLQDMRGSISQAEVEHCYRLWALLVGLPPSRATTVWVRITHYATAFLHALPMHGLPVRGIRLI